MSRTKKRQWPDKWEIKAVIKSPEKAPDDYQILEYETDLDAVVAEKIIELLTNAVCVMENELT
jgi:hypothetical protein